MYLKGDESSGQGYKIGGGGINENLFATPSIFHYFL